MTSTQKPVVVDPDPTEMQLGVFQGIGTDDIEPSDLCNPEAVKFLVFQQRLAVVQARSTQKRLDEVSDDNRQLRQQREDLRIELARRSGRANLTWIEIPLAVLMGFSINILANDHKNGLGWWLLVISVAMLCMVRSSEIASGFRFLKKSSRQEQNDG